MQTKNSNDAFSVEKQKLVNKIGQFIKLLNDANDMSLSEDTAQSFQDTIKKVQSISKNIENGKLKIALVGAFSDGKTSTVAGFLGHGEANMKIADEESSDEIIEYEPENIDADVPSCVFVDTPGLFGQKFSDITKKYISEAHIILFVVNATNPLKDSHRDTLKWLFKTLKKFDNTIFVINRMDDVCDYTDPEDFAEKAATKTKYLKENVAEICGSEENINVVCISSDPDGLGLMDDGKHENYWLTPERREKYEKYSKMQNLRSDVNNVIKDTLVGKLIQETALTAISQEVNSNLEKLKEEQIDLGKAAIPELKNTISSLEDDLSNTKKDLNIEIRPCREELESLEKSILSKIRNASMENLNEILEDEIGTVGGEVGYRLEGKIQDILRDHFEEIVTMSCNKMRTDFEQGEINIDNAVNLVKLGAGNIGKMAQGVNKAAVFAGRDLLGKVGIAVKFKPWGAVKLAKFINNGIPFIGAGLALFADVYQMVKSAAQNKKFQEAKQNISEGIQETFKSIYDGFKPENFFDTFAPQVIEMEQAIAMANDKLKELENAEENCKNMQKQISDFWGNNISDAEIVA